jgi:hypothetical protein
LRRAEGGANIFGVFRVKNHDFMPKNHIFSNYGGRRENFWGISCEKIVILRQKIIFFPILGPPPPWHLFTLLVAREFEVVLLCDGCGLTPPANWYFWLIGWLLLRVQCKWEVFQLYLKIIIYTRLPYSVGLENTYIHTNAMDCRQFYT